MVMARWACGRKPCIGGTQDLAENAWMLVWTDYMKHRARLRGFDLDEVERILRFSKERYSDTATGRSIAIGRHGKSLVMVPYDEDDDAMTPVTIHLITRRQINLRLKSGRFRYE